MNWLKGLWRGVVNIPKKVLSVFGLALQSFVAQEAAGYFQTALELVRDAETQFGSGAGQAKYDYVVAQFKKRLGDRFASTPMRVLDFAIHMAVAQISDGK